MTFAKIFETELGQVVVMKQGNDDDGSPEIRFFAQPEGHGVCSMAFGYSDDDEGWERADEGFEKVDMNMAISAIKQLRKVTCDA